MLAGFEIGGTKIVCALGPDPQTLTHQTTFPTTTPDQAIPAMLNFLRAANGAVRAIGIGSFGPLSLHPQAADFGAILATPKPGWAGANLRDALADATSLPVGIDTDVNAAGLAEARYGAGIGLGSLAYVTIGTGIGGGLIMGGVPLHGLTHPEMGHVRPRRHAADDFAGLCPFHGDCLEGLASGRALAARRGAALSDLAETDPVWGFAADYLGQMCAMLALTWCPERIVLGGGVPVNNPGLFPRIHQATRDWLGGYLGHPALTAEIGAYIVPPALGNNAGITGALALAAEAAQAAAVSAGKL